MAEELQTPQGEVGASGEGSQQPPADDKRTSLIGSNEPEVAEGEKPPVEGEKPTAEGDDGTKLKEDNDGEGDKGAPEEYAAFTTPGGLELDTAAMEKATPVFKELGLSQEKSQKLVDVYAGLVQETVAKQQQDLNDLRDGWAKEITSDPGHKQTLADAKKAVEAFGDDEVKNLLYDNWVGDHPAVVRLLGKIGAAMNNDKFIEGGPVSDSRGALGRIYTKME